LVCSYLSRTGRSSTHIKVKVKVTGAIDGDTSVDLWVVLIQLTGNYVIVLAWVTINSQSDSVPECQKIEMYVRPQWPSVV